jgi:tetratricopeptide (TPR) repeat protein
MNFRAYITALFLFLGCCILQGQKSSDERLLQVLSAAKNDSDKCLKLNQLIEDELDITVWPRYNLELMALVESCLKTCSTKQRPFFLRMQADAIGNSGFLNQQYGNYKEAIEDYRKAIEIQFDIGDKVGIANSLSNIGYIYFAAADYEKASDCYNKALKIQEEIQEKGGASTSLVNLATVFLSVGDTLQSVELFNKALRYKEGVEDKAGIANCYNSLAVIYGGGKDLSLAMNYLEKAIVLQKERGDKTGLCNTYSNLAAAYRRLDKIDEALKFVKIALHLADELKDGKGRAVSYNLLADISNFQKRWKEAQLYFEKALKFSQGANELKQVQIAAKGLTGLYGFLGKKREQKAMQDLYDRITDSLSRKVVIRVIETDTLRPISEQLISVENMEYRPEESGLKSFLALSLLVVVILILLVFYLIRRKAS